MENIYGDGGEQHDTEERHIHGGEHQADYPAQLSDDKAGVFDNLTHALDEAMDVHAEYLIYATSAGIADWPPHRMVTGHFSPLIATHKHIRAPRMDASSSTAPESEEWSRTYYEQAFRPIMLSVLLDQVDWPSVEATNRDALSALDTGHSLSFGMFIARGDLANLWLATYSKELLLDHANHSKFLRAFFLGKDAMVGHIKMVKKGSELLGGSVEVTGEYNSDALEDALGRARHGTKITSKDIEFS